MPEEGQETKYLDQKKKKIHDLWKKIKTKPFDIEERVGNLSVFCLVLVNGKKALSSRTMH